MRSEKQRRRIPAIRRYRKAALMEVFLIIVLCILIAVIISRKMEPTYQIREDRLLQNADVVHVITMPPDDPSDADVLWVKYSVPLDDELQQYIEKLCGTDIDPAVVMALIMVESGGDAWAISDDGQDFGLMQIRQDYHLDRMEKLDVTELLDPYQNVTVGVDLLRELSEDYGKPIEWTLMAYNGGVAYANNMYANGNISQYVQKIMLLAEEYDEGSQVMG